MVLIYISLMINDVEHFYVFMGHLYIFFEEMSIQILCSFLTGFFVLLLSHESSLYILECKSIRYDLQIFSHSLWIAILLSPGYSLKYKVFSFDKIQLASLSFIACALVLYLKKSLTNQTSQRLHFMSASMSFIILALTFSCMIHFELMFVYRVR